MNRLLYITLALSLCICREFRAQSPFYDTGTLQKIEIWFSQAKWDYMLDTARFGADGRLMAAWVKINGTRLDSVGVKYKGSSSYDSTFAKNPINIELNTYKEQNYQGFTDLKLNNAYADPSLVREVMAYEFARMYMDAPQANFAEVYINGNYMGVYTNAESINNAYTSKHFLSSGGAFVKCNPFLTPSPSVKSNLKYINADTSSYYNYYEMKSDYGWTQLKNLCDTLSNYSAYAGHVIDMDKVCRMLAFNNLLVNLDSYSGVFAQNYYLYKDAQHRFNPLIWDLNMSFGGFPFAGSSNSSLANLSISGMQSMPVSIHSTDDYWPLIKIMYNNARYKKMYLAHLRTMLDELFVSGLYATKYNAYTTLISSLALSDTKKFFSSAQFQSSFTTNISAGTYSVPGIQNLVNGRMAYLQSLPELTVGAPAISTVAPVYTTLSFNSQVNFTAQVSNADVSSVFLGYRYSTARHFTLQQMYDDGLHGDGAAADGVYGSALTMNGNNLQYYVYAENSAAGAYLPRRAAYEYFTLSVHPLPQAGEVTVNEFLTDNKGDVKNEYHLNEDWIELYNNSNKPLSLSGLCLSNDYGELSKYVFTSTAVIQPYSFFTVWADNIIKPGATQQHCNFKLDNSGGSIWLSNGAYQNHDAVSYVAQEEDQSTGRCGDGTGPFRTFKYPTFGMSNCVVGIGEEEMNEMFVIYPNPCHTEVKVISGDERGVLTVNDLMGEEVYKQPVVSVTTINTAGWPVGVYIMRLNNQSKKLVVTH